MLSLADDAALIVQDEVKMTPPAKCPELSGLTTHAVPAYRLVQVVALKKIEKDAEIFIDYGCLYFNEVKSESDQSDASVEEEEVEVERKKVSNCL
jgi:hypothetical protein